MLNSIQPFYLSVCKWSYRNFGPGNLPRFKSLFNVSFLLIILLTNALLVTELLIKSHRTGLNLSFATIIVFGAVVFMLLNHFILLNNKWLKKMNVSMSNIGKHNQNTWSVILLINVMVTCGFFILTV